MSPLQARSCCADVDDRLDAEVFKALGDATRAGIFACLVKCGRPCTVGEVAECCAVDFSVVSRHLRRLETAGFLESRRNGRFVAYAVRFSHVCGLLRDLALAIEEQAPPEDLAPEAALHGKR